MKYGILIFSILVISGCATDGSPVIGGGGIGTYKFSGDAEGFEIEASTLRGGPNVDYTVNPNGSATLRISPSNQAIIQSVLESIAP